MRWLAALFILSPLAVARTAEPDFVVPELTGPVVDAGHLLQPRAQEIVGDYLRRLRESGGSQITVATIEDLGTLSIEEAAIKIADGWKLGSAKQDDGILFLIAEKQRRIRIEVGQGREGVLPDAIASRIVREVVVPRMKKGSVDRAVAEGVQAIVSHTDPEFAQREPFGLGQAHPHHEKTHVKLFMVLFWLVLLILLTRRNRFLGGAATGGLMSGPFGSYGGSGGGSNDSWSGGGGGFSGGGASGDW